MTCADVLGVEPSPALIEPAAVADDIEPEPTDARADAPEAVVVRFGGSRYGVPMSDVAEVVSVPRVTRVPGTPDWLTGVVNWRGRVLAVLDLRPVIGHEQSPLPSSARVVVVSADGVEAGLLVEAVSGLLSSDAGAVEPIPATVGAAAAELIAGLVDDHGPLALLDAPAVLRLRASLPSLRSG